jgi:hypothetical protein
MSPPNDERRPGVGGVADEAAGERAASCPDDTASARPLQPPTPHRRQGCACPPGGCPYGPLRTIYGGRHQYELTVRGRPVRLTAAKLLSHRSVRTAALAQAGILLPSLQQRRWEIELWGLMREATAGPRTRPRAASEAARRSGRP